MATNPSGRQVLPIPDRPHVGVTTYDAKDPATSFPPIEPLRPPEGAPNVLVVLIDDAGFGSSSAFGESAPRELQRLANRGSNTRAATRRALLATRQALMTVRNPTRAWAGYRDRTSDRLQLRQAEVGSPVRRP